MKTKTKISPQNPRDTGTTYEATGINQTHD